MRDCVVVCAHAHLQTIKRLIHGMAHTDCFGASQRAVLEISLVGEASS